MKTNIYKVIKGISSLVGRTWRCDLLGYSCNTSLRRKNRMRYIPLKCDRSNHSCNTLDLERDNPWQSGWHHHT